MRRLHLILGLLALIIGVQAVGMGLFGLLLYQATPNSVLAQQTFIGRVPGMLTSLRTVDRSMNMLYRGPTPPEELPSYDIKISAEDLVNIEESLPSQPPTPWYGNVFLTEDGREWAKAKFTADGVTYDVEMRVRGDIFNHWAYRKKSWRVKFSKDNLFNGMREINLIIPEDRGWFAEMLNVYRMRKFDLLHPNMEFVSVSLNGSKPMLYTQVEHWTKEMLEKQGRIGDANIYKTGGGNSYFQQWNPAFDELAYWEKSLANPRGDTYEEIELLLDLSKEGAHSDPHYMQKLRSVFDVDRLVAWYVVSTLAGSKHVTDFNVRLYFDPSKGLFEPLPWDISLYAPHTLLSLPGNKFLNEAFRVPELKLAAHKMLWEYVQNDEQVAGDLEERDRLRALIERAAYRDSMKLPSNRQVKHEMDSLSSKVDWNLDFLQDELKISEVLQTEHYASAQDQKNGIVRTLDLTARGVAFASLAEISTSPELAAMFENGTLSLWRDNGDGVWNTSDSRVSIAVLKQDEDKGRTVLETQDSKLSLLWTGDPVTDANGTIITAPHTKHRFFIRSSGGDTNPDAFDFTYTIRNAVTGKKAQVIGDIAVDDRTFENLDLAFASREDFLRRYPFFSLEGEDTVVLRGVHVISENVIVPSTVRFELKPGTVLRMEKGVSILSYAPVTAIGYKDSPIRLLSDKSDEPWGVFAVLNSTEPSALQWVEASDGGEAFINGTFFSGMLAFHNSPVTVVDTVVSNAHGDDGMNLKYVYVDVNRVRFERNSADGLDIDMAISGVVENSLFIENGNDGMDISWSPIIIRNIESVDNGDKCISVGERSTPLIYDTVMRGCPIGIAVKDDSHAKLERVRLENNAVAATAYVKKLFFAQPSIAITESTFEGNREKTLALSGAVITIDSAN